MSRLSPNTLGSLFMVAGSLGYVVNDALVRRATENDIGVYQVLFVRSVALAALLWGIGEWRGQRVTTHRVAGSLAVRVAAEVAAAALFFAAVVRMEFANAQAILQILPLAVLLAAAFVVGERVSAAQFGAVAVGFVGVLVVIRPATDGFSGWSLLVVVSTVILVVRELATRNVPSDVPAVTIAFLTAIGLAALTAVLTLFSGWDAIDGQSALLIALSMAALVVGYLCTIQTVRVGDLSVSAPFRYTTLLGAVVVGYLLFDEVPDVWTVVGGSLIVVSGVVAVLAERRPPI